MRRISHRWYLTLLAWLEEEWDKPDRTDFYLMQIAAYVANQGRKGRHRIDINKYRVRFGTAKETMTKEKFDSLSKDDPKKYLDHLTVMKKAELVARGSP